MSAPAHEGLLVRNVVSILSHRVISRARLYEVFRWLVWSLALFTHDAKQDPVVYGAEFGVVFLEKDPRTASIEEGLYCLGLFHSGLEGERDFRLVVEFT